jgi:predicted lipoprotein with Yx(FWY)xxD motif
MRKSFLLAIATITTVATVAFAQMAPTKTGDSAKGKVLTNDKGMTLYVFDKDSGGKSACNDPCAGNWPPLMATAASKPMGDYSIITRDDGSKQWTYKGRPLYTRAAPRRALSCAACFLRTTPAKKPPPWQCRSWS